MRLIRYESGTDSKVWMKEENHAWIPVFTPFGLQRQQVFSRDWISARRIISPGFFDTFLS